VIAFKSGFKFIAGSFYYNSGLGLSIPTTLYPRFLNTLHKSDPSYPAHPVIAIVFLSVRIYEY